MPKTIVSRARPSMADVDEKSNLALFVDCSSSAGNRTK